MMNVIVLWYDARSYIPFPAFQMQRHMKTKGQKMKLMEGDEVKMEGDEVR